MPELRMAIMALQHVAQDFFTNQCLAVSSAPKTINFAVFFTLLYFSMNLCTSKIFISLAQVAAFGRSMTHGLHIFSDQDLQNFKKFSNTVSNVAEFQELYSAMSPSNIIGYSKDVGFDWQCETKILYYKNSSNAITSLYLKPEKPTNK